MKWLDDNPLGIALGVSCGLLLLVLVVLLVLSSLPLPPGLGASEADNADSGLELPQLAENKPIDTYNVITRRPLFNETRQPVPDDGSNLDGALDEEVVDAPDVELSGVVITPTLRMVTLRRKDEDRSLVAFEGKTIEADFGTWQVSSIEARAVTMTSGSGEELHLEMKVHDVEIEQPDLPAPKKEQVTAESDATEQQSSEAEPLSRAEEIRQRIAERREELRREAEQAEAGGQEQPEPGYKDAIQSMIGSGRRKQTNKENER